MHRNFLWNLRRFLVAGRKISDKLCTYNTDALWCRERAATGMRPCWCLKLAVRRLIGTDQKTVHGGKRPKKNKTKLAFHFLTFRLCLFPFFTTFLASAIADELPHRWTYFYSEFQFHGVKGKKNWERVKENSCAMVRRRIQVRPLLPSVFSSLLCWGEEKGGNSPKSGSVDVLTSLPAPERSPFVSCSSTCGDCR